MPIHTHSQRELCEYALLIVKTPDGFSSFLRYVYAVMVNINFVGSEILDCFNHMHLMYVCISFWKVAINEFFICV